MLWYEIRDLFLGQNFRPMDCRLAVKKAAQCSRPEAKWLLDLFNGRDPDTIEPHHVLNSLAVAVFDRQDVRARTFLAVLEVPEDHVAIRDCAESGDPFAQVFPPVLGLRFFFFLFFFFDQAWVCVYESLSREQQLGFARRSLDQNERDGMFRYAAQLEFGAKRGSKQEILGLYKKAASLGHVGAMNAIGNMLCDADPDRWTYWGKAAERGHMKNFLTFFPSQLRFANTERSHIVYLIGEFLSRRILVYEPGELLENVTAAVSFYKKQVRAAEEAVHAWTLVGTRLHVIKDVRKIIGLMLWEDRKAARYIV